jgi:hypothetical protein
MEQLNINSHQMLLNIIEHQKQKIKHKKEMLQILKRTLLHEQSIIGLNLKLLAEYNKGIHQLKSESKKPKTQCKILKLKTI